jgi:hypothetical protein
MASVLAVLARELSGFGLTWLVQSSVLLTLGLLAGRLLSSGFADLRANRDRPGRRICRRRTQCRAMGEIGT